MPSRCWYWSFRLKLCWLALLPVHWEMESMNIRNSFRLRRLESRALWWLLKCINVDRNFICIILPLLSLLRKLDLLLLLLFVCFLWRFEIGFNFEQLRFFSFSILRFGLRFQNRFDWRLIDNWDALFLSGHRTKSSLFRICIWLHWILPSYETRFPDNICMSIIRNKVVLNSLQYYLLSLLIFKNVSLFAFVEILYLFI